MAPPALQPQCNWRKKVSLVPLVLWKVGPSDPLLGSPMMSRSAAQVARLLEDPPGP